MASCLGAISLPGKAESLNSIIQAVVALGPKCARIFQRLEKLSLVNFFLGFCSASCEAMESWKSSDFSKKQKRPQKRFLVHFPSTNAVQNPSQPYFSLLLFLVFILCERGPWLNTWTEVDKYVHYWGVTLV